MSRAGEVVLQKGRTLKPQDLGVLAMLGAHVEVHKKPRAALLSSGDELLEVDAPLESGKIRDSNSYTLAALIESAGGQVMRLGVARDTRESVQRLFDNAIREDADLIMSSAGVSVGAFDFVKEVVESNGAAGFLAREHAPGQTAGVRRVSRKFRSSVCRATRFLRSLGSRSSCVP
jgi:molybdopterin molybdotransferase